MQKLRQFSQEEQYKNKIALKRSQNHVLGYDKSLDAVIAANNGYTRY